LNNRVILSWGGMTIASYQIFETSYPHFGWHLI
jgi:hypothetical protein